MDPPPAAACTSDASYPAAPAIHHPQNRQTAQNPRKLPQIRAKTRLTSGTNAPIIASNRVQPPSVTYPINDSRNDSRRHAHQPFRSATDPIPSVPTGIHGHPRQRPNRKRPASGLSSCSSKRADPWGHRGSQHPGRVRRGPQKPPPGARQNSIRYYSLRNPSGRRADHPTGNQPRNRWQSGTERTNLTTAPTNPNFRTRPSYQRRYCNANVPALTDNNRVPNRAVQPPPSYRCRRHPGPSTVIPAPAPSFRRKPESNLPAATVRPLNPTASNPTPTAY